MQAPVHGILLLDKPGGFTSNAALQRVRRLFGKPKAGHTGSLDPMATGLLPICFGEATRVSGLLLDARKGYQAEACFGQRMDTGDATGEVVAEAPLPALTTESGAQLTQAFTGKLQQVPPMYSALKQQGRRLYQLARQGQEVERKARAIEIHQLDLQQLDELGMRFEVLCSKGTYIRVLIEDMARALGTEAYMTALRRTRVAQFRLEDAITLERLEQLDLEERIARLLPVDTALEQYPALQLDAHQAQRLLQGQRFRVQQDRLTADCVYRAYGPEERFLGLVRPDATGLLQIERLFPHSAGLL